MWVRYRKLHGGQWSRWHEQVALRISDPVRCGLQVYPDENSAERPKHGVCARCAPRKRRPAIGRRRR